MLASPSPSGFAQDRADQNGHASGVPRDSFKALICLSCPNGSVWQLGKPSPRKPRGANSSPRPASRKTGLSVTREQRTAVAAAPPRTLVGVFRAAKWGAYAQSLGPSPHLRVDLPRGLGRARDGDIVRLSITGQNRRGLLGRIEEVLSRANLAQTATSAAVAAHGIPTQWRGADQASPAPIAAADRSGREDLRRLPLITIDGASARDFDDAVYAQPEGAGWRLLVAIADVGHYVAPGSALDAIAAERGTSVYFPEQVIPMLPEALSNGICSLRPNEDRLALVCDMKVDRAGRIAAHRFYEGTIRSQARLTYREAESFRQGGPSGIDGQAAKSLAALFEVHGALRQAREARGALDFPPLESVLELRDGAVQAIKPRPRLQSQQLIEEAMIAANVCAASFLQRRKVQALLRVHEPPDPAKAEILASAFAMASVSLPKEGLTVAALQRALRAVRPRPDSWLFEMLALQAMQRARYQPEQEGHFALALERYAHFTSPIRRYPDLLVHRAIKAALHGETSKLPDQGTLADLGQSASLAERRAEDASRMVDAWLKCAYLAPSIGETFSAVIAGVADFGLFAELEGFHIQGLLHVSALGGDYFRHVPPFHLVGEASNVRYRLGDAIEVRLAGAQPELGRLTLELAGSPPRRGGRRRPGRGRKTPSALAGIAGRC